MFKFIYGVEKINAQDYRTIPDGISMAFTATIPKTNTYRLKKGGLN
jgi:hypothetical protein